MSDIKIPIELCSHTDVKLESIDVESSTVTLPIKPVSPAEPKPELVVLPNSPKPFVKGHSGTDAWSPLARRPTAKAKTAAILDSAQPRTPTITVLQALKGSLRKEFRLNVEGEPKAPEIDMGSLFNWRCEPVNNVHDLSRLIEKLSAESNRMLIRGKPATKQWQKIRRRTENFPEPPEGCPWLMLDFDDVALPEGVSTIDPASIEYVIRKLPEQFHGASFFFQFSSSSGILNSDGSLRKAGISVHLFYWLDRPVHGKDISAWLRLHCIETTWYERTFNKRGDSWIKYGIDDAIYRDVQPHLVALPLLGPGVRCSLLPEARQGLVEKNICTVEVPEVTAVCRAKAPSKSHQILTEWQKANGYVYKSSISRYSHGVIRSNSYMSHPVTRQTAGLTLVNHAIKEVQTKDGTLVSFATLFFDEEVSKGGWYVCSLTPETAVHYGDSERRPLKELSVSAYTFVRDEQKWFTEIETNLLPLTEGGRLPPFNDFIKVRNTLVLAPTGSGKSFAFCQYAQENQKREIIVYAAQTIALTHQVAADLRRAGVLVHHYQTFTGGHPRLMPGVYVTTNKSLVKFVRQLRFQGSGFVLVIDEAHVALEDFMQRTESSKLFVEAMRRASKTILMTGTITDLQRAKIAQCVEEAIGNLNDEVFAICEFQAVSSHPLLWAKEEDFGTDLIALMRSHQTLKAAGQPLPRTVVIVPTSKIRMYKNMLEAFGLTDDAKVVSRTEVRQEDVEAARTSDKPWLISSPLFAIGLNFEHPPVRLWTSFGRLQVDTSQIIQTVNRANRTGIACEVRLYVGRLDETPAGWVDELEERQAIEAFLQEETDTPGVIEPIHLLDRMTYLEMRNRLEKNTARSMFALKRDNSIQNYAIIEDWTDDLPRLSTDADTFNGFREEANQEYDEDVQAIYDQYSGENINVRLFHLGQAVARKSRSYEEQCKIPKEYDDQILGILATITDNPEHRRRTNKVHAKSILRLHGNAVSFYTSQYDTDITRAWKQALPSKVRSIAAVVELLYQLKLGKIDGVAFGRKMRLKENRKGIEALATSEQDFIKCTKMLARLDELNSEQANEKKSNRAKTDKEFFKAAIEFLGRIGITFRKERGPSRRLELQADKPVVPDWDFEDMAVNLMILAQSIEHRDELHPDTATAARSSADLPVALSICQNCVHCRLDEECHLGIPIQFLNDGLEPSRNDCDQFRMLSVQVRNLKAARNRQEI